MRPADLSNEPQRNAEPAGSLCPSCGRSNDDWESVCRHCGAAVAAPERAMQVEAGHIGYLLHEMAGWSPRVFLPLRTEQILRAEYLRRRSVLLGRLTHSGAADAVPQPAAPPDVATHGHAAASPPVVPDLPRTSGSGRNASVVPDLPAATRPPSVPVRPSSGSGAVAQPGRAAAPPRPALRDFLEEHALKLVFGLATILVLVALRSMVEWDWLGALAMRAIPLAPLALSGLFWAFGEKTRRADAWAAVIYHGLAAVLIGFDVVAVNKYWFSGALSVRNAYLVSRLAATFAAALMLRRHREPAYLHLFRCLCRCSAAETSLMAPSALRRPCA